MTDEQFNKLLDVQTAQVAMLHGIYMCISAIAAGKGQTSTHNWDQVQKALENAAAIRQKMTK